MWRIHILVQHGFLIGIFNSAPSQIPEYLFSILQIRRAEGFRKITLLLQNLQVEHHCRKDRKASGQSIAEHQQHPQILQIKPQECRIAAETVDAGCDKLCPVFVRDSYAPAVPHAQNGDQKDQIPQHPQTKAGETGVVRQVAPAERNGQQLSGDDSHCGNAHTDFHSMDRGLLLAVNLLGTNALTLLRSHFQ